MSDTSGEQSFNQTTCSLCCSEKRMVDFLYCGNSDCSFKICHGCMSFQVTKFLSKYDYTWTGLETKEIIIDENIDTGGINWKCPSCSQCSVINETDLMLCAKSKNIRDDALDILKSKIE
jgi:hypothetical protein